MNNRRWTLTFIAIAVIGTVGVVVYRTSMHASRVDQAIAEIEELQADIDSYYWTHDDYPRTLADVGHGDRLDPWGTPYQFVSYGTVEKRKGIRHYRFLYYGTFDRRTVIRDDRNVVTLNSHYDLFSAGPDGEWEEPLKSKVSLDDIIRARDGEFVGLAERW